MNDWPAHLDQPLVDGPEDAEHTIVLAHGAGAGMDSDFLTTVATGLARCQLRVVRFEFPYMRRRRRDGSRRPPDREPVLRATWCEVIDFLGGGARLVIGGKSMGGRIASLVAAETQVRGVACFGYPFHPAGKPERLRVEHLRTLTTPMLIVQGTRDPLGSRAEVSEYELAPTVQLCWLEDGDHSLRPRVRSGWSAGEHLQTAVHAAVRFVRGLG